MLYIMKKKIDIENSPILYNKTFTKKTLKNNWQVFSGEWWVEDTWLNGKNPYNLPGMIISKMGFPGNVMMEFEARTVKPCTHDINFMWNGSWDEIKNQRDVAYIAGIEGWWEGKVGIEKSPQYKFNAVTPLFNFKPGEIYRILGGSIDGHCFVFINGQLILEATDPDPIDNKKYSKVGFEAYCSFIQIKNLIVRQIKWQPYELSYTPEFK